MAYPFNLSEHFIYLLEVAVFLSLFYFFYIVLLKKETYFKLNRAYLLATLLVSILSPYSYMLNDTFVNDTNLEQITINVTENWREVTPVPKTTETEIQNNDWTLLEVLSIIYVVGFSISLLSFIRSFYVLIFLTIKHGFIKKGGYWLVKLPDIYATFSFFNLLFLSSRDANTHYTEKILIHEEAHIQQWHSLDILLAEMYCAVFWFNPIAYLYKREIQAIHEFLADQYVLRSGVDEETYGTLLINEILGLKDARLTNNFFNTNNLKHRIIMMQKKRSSALSSYKLLLVFPLLGLSLFIGACTEQLKKLEYEKEIELLSFTFKDRDYKKVYFLDPGNAGNRSLTTTVMEVIKDGGLQAYDSSFSQEDPLGKKLSFEEVDKRFTNYWSQEEKDGKIYHNFINPNAPNAKEITFGYTESDFKVNQVGGETYISLIIGGMYYPTGKDMYIASFKLADLERALGANIKFNYKPYPYPGGY